MIPVAILCGGKATRLGSLTATTPKSLINVNGLPFIRHQLDLLRAQGFTKIVLLAGHLGEYLSAAELGPVLFSFDGPFPLGTGGAINKAISLLGDEFFILYGDSYLPINYEPIFSLHRSSGKKATMTFWKGVDYGIGIYTKECFDGWPDAFDLKELQIKLRYNGDTAEFAVSEPFHEIGSPEGLEEVRNLLK
jgi:NDP-sugar pyrophosphorylase family protein